MIILSLIEMVDCLINTIWKNISEGHNGRMKMQHKWKKKQRKREKDKSCLLSTTTLPSCAAYSDISLKNHHSSYLKWQET